MLQKILNTRLSYIHMPTITDTKIKKLLNLLLNRAALDIPHL